MRSKHMFHRTTKVTDEEKAATRALILEKLKEVASESGVVRYDDPHELRIRLRLDASVGMKLFRRSLYHLDKGDKNNNVPLITMRRSLRDEDWKGDMPRKYVIRIL